MLSSGPMDGSQQVASGIATFVPLLAGSVDPHLKPTGRNG